MESGKGFVQPSIKTNKKKRQVLTPRTALEWIQDMGPDIRAVVQMDHGSQWMKSEPRTHRQTDSGREPSTSTYSLEYTIREPAILLLLLYFIYKTRYCDYSKHFENSRN